ncbi:MAG: glycosyl transferase family 2 [Glaciihabitans sp.]|nr:glycosyl transferase family 2 [Glaciihabitans sp.]
MKTTELLISVVIPTRNRNDLLSTCLSRLAPGSQTLPADRYEVIVTDDGGSTSAKDLIAKRFPWAVWLAGPRRGPAANRNNGASHAKGGWLAFTDDDCVPESEWLMAFERARRTDTKVLEGKTTCRIGVKSALFEAPINLTGGKLWSCNFLMRREAFWQLGGFDENFPLPHLEDVDLYTRILKAGLAVHFVPTAVVDHPPRRRKLGRAAAPIWESRVYFWYQHGGKHSTWRWLPVHLLKVRIRQAFEHPLGFSTTRALASAVVELGTVLARLSEWERRHGSMANRNDGPRPPASIL